MTPDEVRKRVATIASTAHDPEAAHGMEDELYQDVLREIADTPPWETGRHSELAAEALKATDLSFERWTT